MEIVDRISRKDWLIILLLGAILILDWSDGNTTRALLLSIFTLFAIPVMRYAKNIGMLVILFSISLFSFSYLTGTNTNIISLLYVCVPCYFFYCIGSYFADRYGENHLQIIVAIIVCVYLLVTVITYINDIIYTGQLVSFSRAVYTDTDREVVFVGDRSILSIGMIGLPLVFFSKSKLKWVYFIVCVLSTICSIHCLHRTPLAVALLLIIFSFFYGKNKDRNKIIPIVLISLFIIAILYWVGSNSDIISLFQDRNSYDAQTLGDRSTRWTDAIGKLFLYPFGWKDSSVGYYVHNMWLDVDRTAGLIPFVLLLTFSIKSFFNIIKTKIIDNSLYFTMTLINIAFLASCFVEPVFEMHPTHAWMYMLFTGMQYRYCVNNTSL